ncbi:MAG: aromatic aminobenezylarsenical efflux permease ArsG family transporter [Bacteroidales bacterium]
MDFLNELIAASNWPVFTALILGLMTAISPCPLATNISAIGFLSRDITNKRKILWQSIIYTLGRSIAYVGLAGIFLLGIDQGEAQGFFATYGERILGPLLILIGLFMLDIIKFRMPGLSVVSKKAEEKSKSGRFWGVLFLGIVFALAFCPYSGVLYFLMLIPLTLSSPEGLLLPFAFSIATALPVILFALLIAFAISAAGRFYDRIKSFEFWFRRVVSVLFILTGIYMIIIVYF